MTEESPLHDRRVRGLIGLSGAAILAFVAIVYLEGTVRWIVLAVAVVDAAVTPYMLRKAIENAENGAEDTAEGAGADDLWH